MTAIDHWLPSWAAEPLAGPDLLRVHGPDGNAVGRVEFTADAAHDESALWEPLRQSTLEVRLDGRDPVPALGGLLDQWIAGAAGTLAAGDHDSALNLIVPSRDLRFVNPLLARGFAPVTTLAARPAGTIAAGAPAIAGPGPVVVRTARPEDLDAIGAMLGRLQRFDQHFGSATERAGAAETLLGSFRGKFDRNPDWTLVLAAGGSLQGFAQVDPPEQAGWVHRMSSAGDRAGYFGYLFVEPGLRSRGAGAALAARAHQTLDAAGVPLTLLHQASNNPYATPFWARQGYRPLWSTWKRRPGFQ